MNMELSMSPQSGANGRDAESEIRRLVQQVATMGTVYDAVRLVPERLATVEADLRAMREASTAREQARIERETAQAALSRQHGEMVSRAIADITDKLTSLGDTMTKLDTKVEEVRMEAHGRKNLERGVLIGGAALISAASTWVVDRLRSGH